MSDKYASYEKLQAYAEDIRISWVNDRDKTETMENLIIILEQIISKPSLEEYFGNDQNAQIYFMNDFTKSVITNILKQPYVYGKNGDDIALNLLFHIYKLFYKFYNKNYSKLFESIRDIFTNIYNISFFFPQNTINKSGITNEKKKYNYSIFNDMKCKDFINNSQYIIKYYIGEKVDILVKHNDSRTAIDQTAWVRGVIKKIENGLYYIEYNGEGYEITFPIGSVKVQPEGQKTLDWDWRTNLKKYDLIDVYDRDEWWPATICEILEENDKNGFKKVKYRVGFRLYLDHFNNKDDEKDSIADHSSFWDDKGAKIDEENQEYIGDDREKDEEIYHFSKRIQKFNTYSETQKQCKEEGQLEVLESIREDLTKDDNLEDNASNNFLLYKKDSKKNIIIGKSTNNSFSFYYALLLKRIEDIGDFEKFVDILQDKPNYDEIYTIFTILNSSIDYIHDKYFEENNDIFKKSFFNYINNLKDKEIKNLPQELVDLATKFLTKITKNNKNNKGNNIKEIIENSYIEEEISLQVLFKMIKSSVFDKRLQGVKDLNDKIIRAQNDDKYLKRMSELIKEHNLVNDIFGPNYHTQIISKSKDIVKLLLKFNQIDEEYINLIWGCTQRGDYEAKITIINLFIDLIPNLPEDFIGKLLNAILSITDGKANEKEIDFMYRLSLVTKSPENKLKICQYFCQSIFKLTTFKMNNPVFEKLTELMRNDENYIIKALEICQQSMKENKYTLICNSLILALIDKFVVIDPNKNPPFHCMKDSLTDFLIDEHLLKIFEDNLSDYIKIAKEKSKSQHLINPEQLIIDGENHGKNIDGRLVFLLKLVDKVYPNYDFIMKIKEILLDNSVFIEDKKNFYLFCENYCFPKNENNINETKNNAKIKLFKIFTEKEQTEMNYNEFRLFIKVFIYLNHSALELNINKNYEDEEYEIKKRENIKDDEIKGVESLWKILFEVKEENVINKLINIIYQIVQDKTTIINNIVKIIEKEDNLEKIQKCYNLLKLFLIESEKNKIIDIKSHYSLLKNYIIRFPLELKNEQNNQNVIELFYDNTSLNEIKEVLMKKYNIPMEYIETKIKKDGQEFKLDHTYNNKSLKEIFNDILKKEKNQKIQFNKILIFSKIKKEREDLFINNELTPKFKNILKIWFDELTEKTGKMNKIYCTNYFLIISNNTEPSIIQKKVEKFFEKYDKEQKGYISEENFYKFYSDFFLEKGKIENVWEHIKKMGYNKYLIRNDEHLKVEHIKNLDLFRYRLSVEDFIDETIDNYNNYPGFNYDLLFFLPTNQNIYEEILFNFNEDSKIYDNVFKNQENILKQLYYLIIIESILQDIELKYIDPTKIFKNSNNSIQTLCSKQYEPYEKYEIESKTTFLEEFIKKNYYEKLIKYNIDTLNRYKKNKNDVLKKCFRKGIQIIKIIFEACLDNIPKNENLIDDNIYYIDYSHINNEIKDKKDIKDKVLNHSYKSLYKNLLDYILNNNNVDDLYNDCFDTVIKLLAFKEKILEDLFKDEKTKNLLYDLIIKSLSSNSPAIIKSLTDTLKKLTSIQSSSDNKFFQFLYDIMKPIFDSMLSNENNEIKLVFFSNEFFEFFTQINDCIYKMKKDPNNKLIIMIVEMLINNINRSNDENKLSDEVLIKYMELILKLIKKNEKIKQQITTFKVNDESLSSVLLEKVILSEFESNKNEKEDKNINLDTTNKFISIEKKDNEDNGLLNKNLKEICTNYILVSFQNENDLNSQKELIRINKTIKEKLENNSNKKNFNKNKSNNNQIQTIFSYTKSLKVCGHVGLYNLGATCYMNSIMQQLYMVPTFRYAIMGADDKDISIYGNYNSTDDNLLHQLQVMYTFLTLSEKQYFNPKYFCHSYKDFNGNPTNPKVQQDSQEFYNNFCEQIEKKLKNTKYKYIINDVFMGKTCSSVICDRCQHISNRLEDFYNLQLEVKNIKNLNESLQKLIIPETIDGFKCEGCDKIVTIQKRTTLCKLPNILIIHLKRFFMNYDYNVTEKINSRFEFLPKIKLKCFCVENFQYGEDNNQNDIYYKNEEYYEYVLKGVNVHLGHANGGHYISFIDVDRDGKGNNMITKKRPIWVKFNDSQLSEFDPLNIPNECYGGEMKNINLENSQNAYLLIYERVKKTPIKVLMEEKDISKDKTKNIINYKKEEESIINKKYDISKRNNDIKEEELYNLIFHNEDNNEYYKYIPFYDVPKLAPRAVYKQIMDENKSLLNKNNNEKSEKNIFLEEELQNKFKNFLNSIISSPNIEDNLKFFSINEQKDLISLLLFNVFEIAKKDNLSEEEKIEINEKMEKVLAKIIKPLINENTNIGILEYIPKTLITNYTIEIIFRNDNPVFIEKNVKEIYEIIISLIELLFYKNRLQLNTLFETVLNYLKDVKSSSNYNGTNISNPIKYIYKIISDLIGYMKEFGKKCVDENLIYILINRIDKENPSNQDIIFNIIKILIKCTEDFITLLFPKEKIEQIEEKAEFKNIKNVKQLFFNKKILELFFEKDYQLLFILIKIFQYEDNNFSLNFNTMILHYLMEFAIKNDKLIIYLELCYNIIDIKDEFCLERMKYILGMPSMIIKPLINNENKENKENNNNQKWPLFGAQLIENNNNDLKTEIYKYISFNKNKFCILSYLLPYEEGKNEDVKIDVKTMIYQLILKCLIGSGNYFIFKYLYLIPARSLYYRNAYEELISNIKDNSTYNMEHLKNNEEIFIKMINYEVNEIFKQRNPNSKKIQKIDKPEFPKEIAENNPDIKIISEFIGYIPDFIPGEIVKKEFQVIIKSKYFELLRIEYFTKYYDLNEFKNILNEQKGIDIKTEDNKKDIDINEILNEKEKTIKVDISNEDYQKDEYRLINKISKKFGKSVDKFIIEDKLFSNDENIINSMVRYILINKKPINNKINISIRFRKDIKVHVKDNMCTIGFLIDYVDRHNYVDFLDINRIKKDEKFLLKDDIYISIESTAYINK